MIKEIKADYVFERDGKFHAEFSMDNFNKITESYNEAINIINYLQWCITKVKGDACPICNMFNFRGHEDDCFIGNFLKEEE